MNRGVGESEWGRFFASRPGRRFQERYHRHRAALSRRSPLLRVLLLVCGMASTALGLIMLVTPGPGVLFLAIGAGLIGNESLLAARFFDWLELRVRALIEGFRRWRRRRRGKTGG